ncbi:MAG TPA: hypothetical protein ENH15_03870 [Actinobacteria bacterium]|nr:hypothetical protein [Actinomycetota bacterium]
MRRAVAVNLLLALVLIGSACSRGEDEASVTTVVSESAATTAVLVAPTVVSDEPADSGEDEAAATTSTTQLVGGTPTYEVVDRVEADAGDELVVVVEPGTYSEVELQNLVFDIVDRFKPLTVVVVDDPAAAVLAFAEDLSDDEAALLASRTFLTITDGIEVTFSGPYAGIADLTIGS